MLVDAREKPRSPDFSPQKIDSSSCGTLLIFRSVPNEPMMHWGAWFIKAEAKISFHRLVYHARSRFAVAVLPTPQKSLAFAGSGHPPALLAFKVRAKVDCQHLWKQLQCIALFQLSILQGLVASAYSALIADPDDCVALAVKMLDCFVCSRDDPLVAEVADELCP